MEHPATVAYLTVQDVLWIHLQLTKAPAPFRYAELEEATHYQYAYGGSKNVVAQAARFIAGFGARKPFDSANEATAFVASMAFLLLNGRGLSLPDSEGAHWFGKVAGNSVQADKAIEMICTAGDGHGLTTVEAAVQAVIGRFPNTVAALVGGAVPA